MKKFIFVFFAGIFMTHILAAQEESAAADTITTEENNSLPVAWKPPVLKLDFPLFDVPYQFDVMNTVEYGFWGSYGSPSMNQSMAVTLDVYSAMHFGLKKLYDTLSIDAMWKNAAYYGGTAAGILLFAYIAPFGYPWMHNEFTRSILTQFDVNSINHGYNPFDSIGGIAGISDSALERFKKESPADFVRMNSAGVEGYLLFSDKMTRNIFLYDLNNLSNFTALFSTWFGAVPHIMLAFLNDYGLANPDETIDAIYHDDGGEMSRHIYGYSSINWVYELFRPNEPYSKRGVHPSGDGVARYIKLSQLSGSEKDYLLKQSILGVLNFLSPAFYGFSSIPLGKSGVSGNFTLHHYLTSFGTDTPVELMLKKEDFNIMLTYHNYMNYDNYFFSVEAEIIDYAVKIFGAEVLFSPRVMIGMQPKDQQFKTSAPEFFGLIGLRTDVPVNKNIYIFCDVTAKTPGWIAGNEYLDKNISIAIGVSMRY
jgi:hypothetical protein